MPIYEYHCQDCDISFETFVRPGHYDDAECPTCHGGRLSREMSVFASSGGARRESTLPAGGGGAMRGGGCCGGACGCG